MRSAHERVVEAQGRRRRGADHPRAAAAKSSRAFAEKLATAVKRAEHFEASVCLFYHTFSDAWRFRKFCKDPETARKLTPSYDMGCKRITPSDDYLQAFNSEKVSLVTEGITEVTFQ